MRSELSRSAWVVRRPRDATKLAVAAAHQTTEMPSGRLRGRRSARRPTCANDGADSVPHSEASERGRWVQAATIAATRRCVPLPQRHWDPDRTVRRSLFIDVRAPKLANVSRERVRCAFEVFLCFATMMFAVANIEARPPANAILCVTLKNEQLEI
jgi:hypothetical protein